MSQKRSNKDFPLARGFTLIELMIAVTIISISILGMMSAFGVITHSVQTSKAKSVATNLVQEKIESLKNEKYYRLLVTTVPATETGITPNFLYDTTNYPPEIPLTVGGIVFDRRVYIHKVAENPATGDLEDVNYSDPDTGLKEVRIYVIWQQGGEWKSVMLRNLRDDPDRNPTDASFVGDVQSSGVDLTSATVEVLENPVWNDLTDGAGAFSFQVIAGTFNVRASRTGYFSQTKEALSIAGSPTAIPTFNLIKMATGTITGTAYLRDHLVLSQVVGSTTTGTITEEYVEIFNPTTFTWTIDGQVGLKFQRADDGAKIVIGIDYGTPTIPSGGYYLFANTSPIHVVGQSIIPDARWNADTGAGTNHNNFTTFNANNDHNILTTYNTDTEGEGSLELYMVSSGEILDQFGWSGGITGACPAYGAPPFAEGNYLQECRGLNVDEQYLRESNLTGYDDTKGPAQDTQDSNSDWSIEKPIAYAPKTALDAIQAIETGDPAAGAIVFTNDGLAPAASADSDGVFSLIGIATGTWVLTIASGTSYIDIENVAITANTNTDVATVVVSSYTDQGYVTGQVLDVNSAALPNIEVAGPGDSTTSDAAGNYRLLVNTGTNIEIVANPGNDSSPNYISAAQNVSVGLGELVQNTDFTLSKGARLRGFSTANGTDPYPGLVVSAKKQGIAIAQAVAESDGYFTLVNISTGEIVIEMQPASGESVNPSSTTRTVAESDAGTTIFIGTFTVSGALGTIVGTVTEGGELIQTGVLLVITTATIAGDPPTNDISLRSNATLYFSGSSAADGNFDVQVPGGFTYNIYGWYTDAAGNTSRQDKSVAVTAGAATASQELPW